MTDQSRFSAFTNQPPGIQDTFPDPESQVRLSYGDPTQYYDQWESPTTIISDGPGRKSGCVQSAGGLREWYQPQIDAWGDFATPRTTLWFIGAEYDWAQLNTLIESDGWTFKDCIIWQQPDSVLPPKTDPGSYLSLTTVCVRYVRTNRIPVGNTLYPVSEWVASEWQRTGLPTSVLADDCSLTADFGKLVSSDFDVVPTPSEIVAIADCANSVASTGSPPYFSIQGESLTESLWESYSPVFHRDADMTNVWTDTVNRDCRVTVSIEDSVSTQKPVRMIRRLLHTSSTVGDTVWVPFAGVGEAAVAAKLLGRVCRGAEWRRCAYEHASDWVDSIQVGSGGSDTQATFGSFE